MKKIICNYEYVGDDPDIKTVPYGYIDKTICGCGLTSLAIEGDDNTIIAVPTVYLTINKANQYPSTRYNGTVLPVWGDTSDSTIEHYVSNNNKYKIIVTYDSLHRVEHLLCNSRLIIDESNELLSKTKMKPEVINSVFRIAERYRDTVSFISATPTPLRYMPKWISDIEQVTIEFTHTFKTIPILCKRTYPFKALKDEFIKPLKDNDTITVAGKTFGKVLVFLNTVTQIAEIIKESDLDKNLCGIICGDNLKNDAKIMGISRYHSGVLPKFLFCTSTGFCGIDLYDSEVMTIVVSSTKKNWQMIDMLTDLKQAVSRQRNKDNPNYGCYIYIYNQSIFEKSDEDLLMITQTIYSKIIQSIKLWDYAKENNLTDGYSTSVDFHHYTLKVGNDYIINEQAFRADEYFILEIRNQYKTGFNINGCFEEYEVLNNIEIPSDIGYKDLVDFFDENNTEGIIDWNVFSTHHKWIKIIESSYRLFGKTWKDYSYAKKMIENYDDVYQQIILEIKSKFVNGIRYSRKEIKIILENIYCEFKINRVAKHTDLFNIMKVKEVTIKGQRMIEIISKSK
ncbi:MAG: hypothetical protein ACOYO1_20070 [Bacteroidales bacterium]